VASAAAILAALALATSCVTSPSVRAGSSGSDRYVSLGDSWVSGVLIGRQVGNPIDCGRSDENFPSRIARELDVATFTDVSCGGANIEDLWEPTRVNLGGRAPAQFDVLTADTTLVTIGIGGNDAGISGLGLDCVNIIPIPLGPAPFGRPCIGDFVKNGRDEISEKIDKARVELRDAFAEIRRLAPDADVYVTGYGAAMPDTGPGCWPQVPILPPDAEYLRSKMKQVNAVIEQEATAAGFEFFDAWAATVGHDLCQNDWVRWMNGVNVEPAGFPAHPNIRYHQAFGRLISKRIRADRADLRLGDKD